MRTLRDISNRSSRRSERGLQSAHGRSGINSALQAPPQRSLNGSSRRKEALTAVPKKMCLLTPTQSERGLQSAHGWSGINSALPVPRNKFRAPSGGFTLIEMIAVLSVIAILVAAIVPSVIRRMDRGAWTRETADLNSIADALTQSILRTKIVPGTNTWATAIATQMSLPVSAITTNPRRFARALDRKSVV